MTEEEWFVEENPAELDWCLRHRQSARKRRLLLCARLQHELNSLPDAEASLALAVAERYADGQISPKEAAIAKEEADAVYERLRAAQGGSLDIKLTAIIAVKALEEMDSAYWSNHFDALRTFKDVCSPDRIACNFLRDIFGNPFRPAAFDPAWRTETAVGIARGIYDGRAFERMPILADALQEAGCENADILTHCREPGTHVRGCWVVDLMLGK